MDKIKIILVDDHQIVRDGIKSLLSRETLFEVIGEASGRDELYGILNYSLPDIILMDISLSNLSGIELTKEITAKFPNIKIIILSMHIGEDFIINAINAGARAYIPKNTTKKELIDSIKAVSVGGEYYPPNISSIIIKNIVRKKLGDAKKHAPKDILTSREIEILKLYCDGMSNKDIGEKLFISVKTVESHKNHIMIKLDLRSQVDLIKYAIREGIVNL
jgi:DNA-binding NarL/FixJ family response regulator